MAITRFQALVARESLADVYINDPAMPDREGDAATVLTIHRNTTFQESWICELESYGAKLWIPVENLDPSGGLVALIEAGTYNEEAMTHQGYEGMVTPLTY